MAFSNSINGAFGGEGSLYGLLYSLEDTEYLRAGEVAKDASDDPMHAGESTPSSVLSDEVVAIHFIDSDEYIYNESDSKNAEMLFDQFNQPVKELTPEDETLLGIDPHHALPIYSPEV